MGSILPDYVLVENVPGFREGNPHQTAFLGILSANGYCVDERIVDAKDYGVPQIRKRYVLLASKGRRIEIPGGCGERQTVRDAISGFPEIGAGQSRPDVANHVAAGLSDRLLKRLKLTPPDGGSRRNTPRSVWTDCHLKHTGHTDTYGRMRWDAPAPTLTCRCISLSNGRFGHPTQHRAISVREAAAIQTFGNGYVFYAPEDPKRGPHRKRRAAADGQGVWRSDNTARRGFGLDRSHPTARFRGSVDRNTQDHIYQCSSP